MKYPTIDSHGKIGELYCTEKEPPKHMVLIGGGLRENYQLHDLAYAKDMNRVLLSIYIADGFMENKADRRQKFLMTYIERWAPWLWSYGLRVDAEGKVMS